MMTPSGLCSCCGAHAVVRHRVAGSAPDAPSFEVNACSACGEYWVEGDGAPLTPELLRKLGLLP